MQIFPTSAIGTVVDGISNALRDNVGVIVGIVAFIAGVSVVMALLDQHTQSKWLDNYSKRWKR